MTIQTLVSTMHQNNHDLIKKMNLQTDAVIINQCDKNSEENFLYNGKRICWINTTDRGLSKSRNMALKYSSADICLIADDDEVFVKNYHELILNAFKKYNADIIRFSINGIERQFKNYPLKVQDIGFRRSLNISSVELAFKKKSIDKRKIKFDELLGAGARFSMGEENALIFSCLKNKMRIIFIPEVIADLHIGNSSWFNGMNEQYFIGRGASYAAMSKYGSILLGIFFITKHYKEYKKEINAFNALMCILEGRKEYLKLQK